MLDGFPRDDETKERETPLAEAGEMLVDFGYGKGTPDKRDLSVVVKTGVGELDTGRRGNFAGAANVDATQNESTLLLVDEMRITNGNHTLSRVTILY